MTRSTGWMARDNDQRRADAVERGATRYTVEGECWISTFSRGTDGYPQVCWGDTDGTRRRMKAHRAGWEYVHGRVPDGQHFDHLLERGCVGPGCIRPDHLEPVTNAVNVSRGGPRTGARAVTCKSGRHARNDAHGHVIEKRGRPTWECVSCRRLRSVK